jgi:threonine dehydrogenase-like Zn-dependent dehydrogenase
MISPGVIEFRDVPVPKPGPEEVLIRVLRIGVCGSDIHVRHGRHPFTSYPVVQGHEFSGVIEEVGKCVKGLRTGQKVTATPQITSRCALPTGDYHMRRPPGPEAGPGLRQSSSCPPTDRPLPASFGFAR